ncbi:hypothetical protein D3C76_1546010 [compost metagenome]
MIGGTGRRKEIVRQTVQIGQHLGIDLLHLAQRNRTAFGAPAHGPADVQRRSQRRSPRQNELLQRRILRLMPVNPSFQALRQFRRHLIAAFRQLDISEIRAAIEELLLDLQQFFAKIAKRLLIR